MASGNELKLRVLFNVIDGATKPLREIMTGNKGAAKSLQETRDRLKHLSETQKRVGEFRDLKRGLQQTASGMSAAQVRVNGLAQQMNAGTAPSRALTREFNQAVKASKAVATQYAQQQQRLEGLRGRLSAGGISTSSLAQHQRTLTRQIDAANLALKQQEERLTRAARTQQRMATARRSFERAKTTAGSAAAVGASSGALGGGILMGAKGLLSPAIDYNASMSKVQALGRLDKASSDYKALRQQSRDLGATTSYTASQAADGQGFLAMAGFKPDQILQAMPSVLSMAKAGNADLARAADISSNIMSGYGLKADQMTRVADVLTLTFTTSNTDLEMLGETMKYMGPVAKAAGMSLEQAAAMAGLLGNAGIQSSQAGTTLRSMLLRLASPTSKAAKALRELGVSSLDAKGDVRDMPSILRDVAAATEKMGSGKRLGFLKRIFGEEPAAGMAELIAQQGASGIDKYVEIIKNASGTAERTAAVMADNLKGDLLTAQSAWQDFGIAVSDTVDGPLRSITQSVSNGIRAVSQWTQANPVLAGTLAKVVMAVGAVLAVVGMLSLTFAAVLVPLAAVKMSLGILGIQGGTAIGVIWNLAKAFVGLNTAFMVSPIGLVVAGVVAVGAVAFLIYRYWEPIKAFFCGLWDGICRTVTDSLNWVASTFAAWSPMNLLQEAFAGIMTWLSSLPARFSQFGEALVAGLVDGITRRFTDLKNAVQGIGDSTIGWFKEKLGIHSPSRVFTRLGAFIGEGAADGITGERGRIAKAALGLATVAATSFAAPATVVGATLGERGSYSALSTEVPIDNRTCGVDTSARASSAPIQTSNHYTINVHVAGSAHAADIGRMVRTEIERIERAKQSRIGSRLSDSAI